MSVLLFRVFYAPPLVLFGAAFTRVQSRHSHEHHRRAAAGARRVKVVKKKKEIPGDSARSDVTRA